MGNKRQTFVPNMTKESTFLEKKPDVSGYFSGETHREWKIKKGTYVGCTDCAQDNLNYSPNVPNTDIHMLHIWFHAIVKNDRLSFVVRVWLITVLNIIAFKQVCLWQMYDSILVTDNWIVSKI